MRHGPPERLGSLTALDEFSDFRHWPRTRDLVISATMRAGTEYRKLQVDPVQAAGLFRTGATLAFESVDQWHPVLGRWVRALARDFGLPADLCHCNVYVSPKGGGVPRHFDSHHVIVVHLIGTKIWTLSPNRNVVHPVDNHVASHEPSPSLARDAHGRISRAMPRGSTRTAMRPGSVLFLPAGHWHATRSMGSSMSVTFGLRTLRWVELLRDAIVARLEPIAEWREPAWGAAGTSRQKDAAARRLDSLLRRMQEDLGQLTATDIIRSAFPRRKKTPRARRD